MLKQCLIIKTYKHPPQRVQTINPEKSNNLTYFGELEALALVNGFIYCVCFDRHLNRKSEIWSGEGDSDSLTSIQDDLLATAPDIDRKLLKSIVNIITVVCDVLCWNFRFKARDLDAMWRNQQNHENMNERFEAKRLIYSLK